MYKKTTTLDKEICIFLKAHEGVKLTDTDIHNFCNNYLNAIYSSYSDDNEILDLTVSLPPKYHKQSIRETLHAFIIQYFKNMYLCIQ